MKNNNKRVSPIDKFYSFEPNPNNPLPLPKNEASKTQTKLKPIGSVVPVNHNRNNQIPSQPKSQKKKNIHAPRPKNNKQKYKLSPLFKFICGFASLGIAIPAFASIIPSHDDSSSTSNDDLISLAFAVDSLNDSFETRVPVVIDNGVIETIPDNSIVFVHGNINSGNNEIIALDENGKKITGIIDGCYLRNIPFSNMLSLYNYNEIYRINPSQACVKLISDPSNLDESFIDTIDGGQFVLVDSENTWTENEQSYSNVLYPNNNEVIYGYINSKYLEQITPDNILDFNIPSNSDTSFIDKPKLPQEITINVWKNNSGKSVTGIDFCSGMLPNNLNTLLSQKKEQIPNIVYDGDYKTDADVSDISGKINFAYIKIGASSYGQNTIWSLSENYKAFLDQALECEKNKIPYGFYYYSTCRTNEEAETEGNFIIKLVNSADEYCKEKLNHSLNYNILPIAIDVELGPDGPDRQECKYAGIESLSKSKATLTNLLNNKLGDSILYTGNQMLFNNNSKIMDIDLYNDNLIQPTQFWHISECSPDGKILSSHQNSREIIKNKNGIFMDQVKLSASIPLNNKSTVQVDLNTINYDTFINYIKNRCPNAKIIEHDELER